MKPEIKSITSPDVDDLQKYSPSEVDNFGILFQLFIGPSDVKGGELFQLEVCTPKWLIERYQEDGWIWGMHRLIVFEYNYPKILKIINNYVSHCERDNWLDVANQLSIMAAWEFQDTN